MPEHDPIQARKHAAERAIVEEAVAEAGRLDITVTGGKDCLSYWFPKLRDAGIPVPKTEIVCWPGDATFGLVNLIEDCNLTRQQMNEFDADYERFSDRLLDAAGRVGFPVFLRTGQGSGKHNWKACCHWTDAAKLDEHVRALVEWSHMVDFMGLAHDVWCCREFLPTKPLMTLPRYGDMPLVREYRGFVRHNNLACLHPYWPPGAVRQGMSQEQIDVGMDVRIEEWAAARAPREVIDLMLRVATAFAEDGAWSVDVLETERGWFVTDMATAERSYHYPGCPNDPHPAPPPADDDRLLAAIFAKPEGTPNG